jgi:hypothetical protein
MWFRMSWVSWSHCICLDVAAENAGPSCEDFINELWRRWRVAAAGGMQSITMAPFIPYMGQPDHHLLLVPFRGNVSTHTERSANGFHCFLSYRWGKVDKLLVTALYEHLTGGMVRGHTMRVFLDDEVFRTAEHFRQAFVESILTTEVFVPIISTNALDRMTCHNPQEVDNLLIEWLTALLLIKFPDLDSCGRLFPLCFIIPVCLEDRSRRSYFSMSTSLSKVVPNAAIKVLKDLLGSRGISCSEAVIQFLEAVTVKEVVDSMMEFICIKINEDDEMLKAVSECCAEICELFLRTDGITVPGSYLSRLDVAVPKSSGCSVC